MASRYAVVRNSLGMNAQKAVFLTVTDGTSVRVVPTELTSYYAEEGQDPAEYELSILQSRIDNYLSNTDEGSRSPEEMLNRLNYNMPFEIEISDEYETIDGAYAAAQERANALNEEQNA